MGFAFVGEEEQIVLGGCCKDVGNELLALGLSADDSAAAAPLHPVNINGLAFDIAGACYGHGHFFVLDQVLPADFALSFDDLSPALVPIGLA